MTTIGGTRDFNRLLKDTLHDHQLMAIKTLFSQKHVGELTPNNPQIKREDDELNIIGIVQLTENNHRFIHRTYSEYFAAMFLVNMLKEQSPNMEASENVLGFIFSTILLEPDYVVIRTFLNDLLAREHPLNKSVLKICGDKLAEVWANSNNDFLLNRSQETPFDVAAAEGNMDVIVFLRDSLEAYPTFLVECLELPNCFGDTVLRLAANQSRLNLVLRLIALEEDVLEAESIKKVICTRRTDGNALLHQAAQFADQVIIKQLFDWMKDKLNEEKTVKELLNSLNNDGNTALHMCLKSGHADVVEFLLGWIENVDNRFFDDLLIVGNHDGNTALHWAVYKGYRYKVRLLFDKLGTNILTSLLRASNNGGNNVFHLACAFHHGHTLDILLYSVEQKLGVKLLIELISARNKYGNTMLQIATQVGNEYVLSIINKLNSEIIRSLIIDANIYGNTVLHIAAEEGGRFLDKLLNSVEEKLGTEVMRRLLTSRNSVNETTLHLAACYGKQDAVRDLLMVAQKQCNGMVLKEFVATQNNDGNTALHLAANTGHVGEMIIIRVSTVDIVMDILNCVQKNLDSEEVMELLNTCNNGGNAVLYEGSWGFYPQKALIDWVCYSLGTDSMTKLVCACNLKGNTLLHLVTERNTDNFYKLLLYLENKLDTDMMRKLVIARNEDGNTFLHCAQSRITVNVIFHCLKQTNFLKELAVMKDNSGNTFLHLAMLRFELSDVTLLIECIEDALDSETIYELIKACNNELKNILHLAIQTGYDEYKDVVKMLNYFQKKLNSDTLRCLLISEDKSGNTVLQDAIILGKVDILEKVCDLVPNTEFLNHLVTRQDNYGCNAGHLAAFCGCANVINKLLDWIKQKLSKNTLSEVLTALDSRGETVLHWATKQHYHLDAIETLLNWASKALSANALTELVIAPNNYGTTVLKSF